MLGFERREEGTLEGLRAMPWMRTSGWERRREVVIRRAILPVKPAIAMVVGEDILRCLSYNLAVFGGIFRAFLFDREEVLYDEVLSSLLLSRLIYTIHPSCPPRTFFPTRKFQFLINPRFGPSQSTDLLSKQAGRTNPK
jgi:hypothetical protein